jgi:curved DNA-binding protein CbpA
MLTPTHRPTPDEFRLFSERIKRTLRDRPIGLSVEDHKARAAMLLRGFGQSNYYEILGITAAASAAEVHEGFERVGRVVHPSHSPRLGLGDREALLEMLFEQVIEAYLTLSQPERRKEYDRELNPEAWALAAGRKARPEELKDRARNYFSRAVTLTAAEDYHFVVELLGQAVRWDPQPDYYLLLGQVLSKNDNWLHRAADSYRQALALGGANPAIEAALRRVEARISGERIEASPEEGQANLESSSSGRRDDDDKRWFVP